MVELLLSPTAERGLTSYDAATAHRPRIDLFSGSRYLGRRRHLYMQSGYFFTEISAERLFTRYLTVTQLYGRGSTSHTVM